MKINLSSFDPEENAFEPVSPGEYPFEIADAVVDVSSSDNEMMSLTLLVEVGREKSVTVFDHLVAVNNAKWKAYGFCQSVGAGSFCR